MNPRRSEVAGSSDSEMRVYLRDIAAPEAHTSDLGKGAKP